MFNYTILEAAKMDMYLVLKALGERKGPRSLDPPVSSAPHSPAQPRKELGWWLGVQARCWCLGGLGEAAALLMTGGLCCLSPTLSLGPLPPDQVLGSVPLGTCADPSVFLVAF